MMSGEKGTEPKGEKEKRQKREKEKGKREASQPRAKPKFYPGQTF